MKCPKCGAKPKRSSDQNRRLHALFKLMQDELTDKNGQRQHLEWWKAMSKYEWLGCIEYRKADGQVLQVLKSTSDCSVDELTEFMNQVESYCARRGVYLEE